MSTKKEIAISVIEDLVINLFYYDRKEDEELEVGDLEDLIESGDLTVDQIVETFKNNLNNYIQNK